LFIKLLLISINPLFLSNILLLFDLFDLIGLLSHELSYTFLASLPFFIDETLCLGVEVG
jgi:hypothetical protein